MKIVKENSDNKLSTNKGSDNYLQFDDSMEHDNDYDNSQDNFECKLKSFYVPVIGKVAKILGIE